MFIGHCRKDSGSCVAPAGIMQRLRRLLSPFGTGFSEHVQGNTTLSTALAADSVHTLLPLPMTTIASLHRIGGRWQQRVVEKRQGFFTMRREDLFSGVANPRESFDRCTQLPQLAQRGLCPTTPVKYGIHMVHDLAQGTQLR